MNRRNLLQVLGVSGATALAGCNTAQEVVRTGPPYFEEIEITGPDQVNVCEEITLEVSVTNTGGETGDFTARLDIGQGILQTSDSISVEDVPVTQSKTTTLEPFWWDRTAEIPFQLTEHDASHTVEVTTLNLGLGEELDCNGEYLMRFSSPRFANALTEGSDEDIEILHAEDDSFLFAVVEAEIETSTEDAYSQYRLISTESENGFMLSNNADLTEINELQNAFDHNELESNQAASGSMVFAVRTGTSGGIDDSIIKNFNSDTPPDVRWSFSDVDAPAFSVDIETPETIEVGREGTVAVRVENTGDGAGTYRAALLKFLNDFGPQQTHVNSVELEPGDTESLEFGITPEGLDKPDFEISPEGVSVDYEVVPRHLDFGEEFTTYDGGTYVVDAPLNRSIYTDELRYTQFGTEQTATTGAGETFVIVDIDVDPEADSILNTVDYSLFTDGQQIEPFSSGFTREYNSPVSGAEYPGNNDSGGLLAFRAPDSAQENGVTIQAMFYGDEGDYPVQWTR